MKICFVANLQLLAHCTFGKMCPYSLAGQQFICSLSPSPQISHTRTCFPEIRPPPLISSGSVRKTRKFLIPLVRKKNQFPVLKMCMWEAILLIASERTFLQGDFLNKGFYVWEIPTNHYETTQLFKLCVCARIYYYCSERTIGMFF